jgi:hypothetical protein
MSSSTTAHPTALNREPEPFPRRSPTRPFLWVVCKDTDYLYGRSGMGRPLFGPCLQQARRFDCREAAAQAARWAGGVAVEIEGSP